MTLTEFDRNVAEVFGATRGSYLVRGHHLAACDGLTAADALAAGHEVKAVWLALCADLDVEERLR